MGIVVADVVAEYGDYYLNHGQSTASLYKKLYRPSVTESYFRRMPTKDTIMRLGSSALDRVLQPFQKGFTPVGTTTFKPHVIQLFQFKIDKQEYPDDIVNSWLGFLEGEGIVRKDWPFVRWMLEEHVFPKAEEEYELSEVWGGVYAAPASGVAGALGTAMNGLGKIFTDNASEMNTIAMGAAPADKVDFCTYVEEYVESMDKEYRKRIDIVFMSEDNELKYKQGKREKYNTNYSQAADLLRIEDFPNARVVGLPSMGSSDKLWSTLANNRVNPVKKSDSTSPIVGEYSPRQVSIYTDWWKCVDFAFYGAVFQSDQD